MSKVYYNLSASDFFQDWSDTSQLTTANNWDGVASIVGYRGDDIITATAVDPRTATADLSGPINVAVNAGAALLESGSASGGVAEFEIADAVVGLNGSGTADAPNLVLYLDGTGRQNLHFSADIRDLELRDNAVQQVAVQYRVGGTGVWTSLSDGYVADATTATTATQVTHLDFDLPASVNGQAQIEIRILTTNAAGNDEWVGIDNIHVTSTAGGAGDTVAPTLTVSNPSDPDNGEVAVAPDAPIVLHFTESVVAGTGSITLTSGADVRVIDVASGQVHFSGATVTIDPSADLNPGATYSLTVDNGAIKDLGGNAFAGVASGAFSFSTLDPDKVVAIYEIQGKSHTSAFDGDKVQTTGVVTAIDSNGFYMQDPTGDGDAATSDGIFVFTGSAPVVTVGQLLKVTGTVDEYRPGDDAASLTITEIVSTGIQVLGTGTVHSTVIGEHGVLPPNHIIEDDHFTSFDPTTDGLDFYESLEGMLVTVEAPKVVDNTNGFGETWVVASGGHGATGLSDRGAMTISDGDYNPERIQIDDDSAIYAGYHPAHTQGDVLGDVTGVVNYSFNAYEVLVTGPVTTTTSVGLVNREFTNLTAAADKLTIATYNLENLDPTDPAAKFQSIAFDIANNLHHPDIIGVQEIQDADGAGSGANLSGAATAQVLINAIVAAGGPLYTYVEVAPTVAGSTGGEPGGNIRNGFLYDASRVHYVDGSARLVLDTDLTNGNAFNNSRNPLAADFVFNDETITAVSVHATSRGGGGPLFGADQPALIAGDASRTAQAVELTKFVNTLEATNPDHHVAVMGDFNGYYFETALAGLEANANLYNLAKSLPVEERYSYKFEGYAQLFDNILVSKDLQSASEFDIVHLNSEQLPSAQLSSDHDASITRITIATTTKLGGGADEADYHASLAAVKIDGGLGDDHLVGGFGGDLLIGGEGADRIAAGAGNDIIRGGVGADRMQGGAGDDMFVFGVGDLALGASLSDHIIDFKGAGSASGGEQDLLIFEGFSAGSKLVFDHDLGNTPTLQIYQVYNGASYAGSLLVQTNTAAHLSSSDYLFQA